MAFYPQQMQQQPNMFNGYWNGGWQAPQAFQPQQMNNFMPKPQNAPEPQNQGNVAMPWILVSSEEDARNRIVQPGSQGWFLDNNSPKFYFKSCDASGAVQFKRYKFEEIGETAVEQQFINSNLGVDDIRKIVDERMTEWLNSTRSDTNGKPVGSNAQSERKLNVGNAAKPVANDATIRAV